MAWTSQSEVLQAILSQRSESPVHRQISKRGVRGLLAEIEEVGSAATVCVSPQTLGARDYDHLLPESEPGRLRVAEVLAAVGRSDTGVAVFVSQDRTVAIQPPFPLSVDVRVAGVASKPILDLLDYRLALASRLGIPHTLDVRDADLREWALGLTAGSGFDRVVECAGGFQQQTVADAVAMVKRGGLITIVGTFPDNRATIPIAYLKDREIDINFSRGNFQAFAPCLELIASGAIDPDRYISHRLPLDRAEDALRLLEARDVEAHKVVLHPRTQE